MKSNSMTQQLSGIRSNSLAWQQGLGLPAAIFVITVLALLAVAINALLSDNAETFEEENNLTRAFYAAESGAGIAMNTVYPPEDYPGYATAECVVGPRIYNFITDGLGNCSASVSCTPISIGTTTYATIESTGSCDGVERTVQVRTSY